MGNNSPRIKLLYDLFKEPLRSLNIDLESILAKSRILDAGCGFGEMISELQKHNPDVYGVDYNSNKIYGIGKIKGAKQRTLYPDKVLLADIRNMSFQDGYFDNIISITLFASTGLQELILYDQILKNKVCYDPRGIMREMVDGIYRVVKKDGLYMLFDNRSIGDLDFGKFKRLYPKNNKIYSPILIFRK